MSTKKSDSRPGRCVLSKFKEAAVYIRHLFGEHPTVALVYFGIYCDECLTAELQPDEITQSAVFVSKMYSSACVFI